MIITFSGVDGSGKTTLATMLRDALVKVGIKAIYRHEYDYFLLKYLFKLIGEKRIEKRRRRFLSSHIEKTALDKLWPYLVYIDTLLLILWYKLFKRDTVLILDRFLYDQLISFEGLGINNKLIKWLYTKTIKPDISIFLTISPEIAYERKRKTHDYDKAFYKKGNEKYIQLAKQLGFTTIYTGNRKPSTTLRQLLEILLYNKKFRGIFIRKSANNRVIYKVVSEYNLKHFKVIKLIFKYKVEKVKRTLYFIQSMMREAGIEWLLFKSYMPFPYVPTYDIDILVKPSDKPKLLKYLISKNIPYKEEEEGKINIRLPNYYTISIHLGATWEGINYVSTKTLWHKVRTVSWHGIPVKIPSFESELLVHVAHIFFELSFIRLSDALYITKLMKMDLDWKIILNEIKIHNWESAFTYIVNLIKRLMDNLGEGASFPHPVPYGYIVKILMGIIIYDLKRKSFSRSKAREYFREMLRFAVWRVGAIVLGRAPFGEILSID